MNRRKSFADQVAATRNNAVDHMMTKAMFANQIAKILTGSDRQRAYDWKHGFISRAMEVGPERVIVDSIDLRQGVLGITNVGNGIRLHAPAPDLTPRAQAVAHEQIARRLGLGLAAA